MLRATDVPSGDDVEELLAGVAVEFASKAMQKMVRQSVGSDGDGGDDNGRGDGGGGPAPGLVPVFRRPDDFDVALKPVAKINDRVDDDVEIDVAPEAAAADPMREWDDLPLCAFWAAPGEPQNCAAMTDGQADEWLSVGGMTANVQLVRCGPEVGKRLNRSVSMMLQHFDLGNCFTLFTGPDLVIDVAMLRAFPTEYRALFATTTWFSAVGSGGGHFSALRAGLYIFSRRRDVLERAVPIVRHVIKLSLSSWLFSCERATLPPLSPEALSICVSSPSELERAVQRRPQALMLTCGTQAVSLGALDAPEAGKLRLLTLVNCNDVPFRRVEALMRRLTQLVVCWHAVNVPAAVELARTFPERVSLQSPFNTDKVRLRSELLAKGLDEDVATTLIGTHLSTVPLRLSAISKRE